jgi:hypothetical protein
MLLTKETMLYQGAAMANNYLSTGRPMKAIEMLSTLKQVDPDDQLSAHMMDAIVNKTLGQPSTDFTPLFGEQWSGQDLKGKSIEVFCDQGMGDTIQLLRYVRDLKQRFDCQVVLNYYAFYNEFERFITTQPYIDKLVAIHEKCDYFTNIMSLPAIMGSLQFDCYYPVHFDEVMKRTAIPDPIVVDVKPAVLKISDGFNVGIAWKSNSQNSLSLEKSIPFELIKRLNIEGLNFWGLIPEQDYPKFVKRPPLDDLYDTAQMIAAVDFVVTVDTAVLHLAGSMWVPTFALLPKEPDPRWGNEDKTVWYRSVKLFRQSDGWESSIEALRQQLCNLKISV